jgi:hypothetical protein
MPALVTICYPDRPFQRLTVHEGEDVLLGRGPSADIRVDDGRISRSHARLAWDGGDWLLEDLTSKNGSTLDGEPVDRPTPLPRICELGLGGVPVRIERLSPEAWRRGSAELEAVSDGCEDGLDSLLGDFLDSVLRITGAERGFVLVEPRSSAPEMAAVAAISGLDRGDLSSPAFTESAQLVERALDRGQRVMGSVPLGDEPGPLRRSALCLPLATMAGSVACGVVYVDCPAADKRRGESDEESACVADLQPLDEEILEALAGHAALAIRAASLKAETELLAAAVPTRAVALPLGATAAGDEPVLWREITARRTRRALHANG